MIGPHWTASYAGTRVIGGRLSFPSPRTRALPPFGNKSGRIRAAPDPPEESSEGFACLDRIASLEAEGLSPSSALALLAGLIAELPDASKEKIERIKTMDKLMNTARALMETRLKTEDADRLFARVEAVERRMDRLGGE
jgi:hypothetical protein